jgi:hypothetical protein
MNTKVIDEQIKAARERKNNRGEKQADKLAAPVDKAIERDAKKAERDAARMVKRAAKEAARRPAHLAKVEKALAKLPVLKANVKTMLNELVAANTLADLENLAAHLAHHVRFERTRSASTSSRNFKAGQVVRIISGNQRLGEVGVIERAQRIRAYVRIDGVKRPLYLFTSDIELVTSGAENSVQVLNQSSAA